MKSDNPKKAPCTLHSLYRVSILYAAILLSITKAESQEYFQQEVNFRISVSLDTEKHELSAAETIQYINNSPDTLRSLYFHLWPNAWSGNDTPLAKQLMAVNGKSRLFSDEDQKGYIDSVDFHINGIRAEWSYLPGQPDVCRILPPESIHPGDTVMITTPFRVRIPGSVVSRLGHSGDYYQVTQWYPKPAVYDSYGWHPMSYMHVGEFYSEFGSYDVSITLPGNFIIGSSGVLQDTAEITRMQELSGIVAERGILFPGDLAGEERKTLRFRADNVHDFAWFTTPRFNVAIDEFILPSGKNITSVFLFTIPDTGLWRNGLSYIERSIRYFSEMSGDYPYSTYTAVLSSLNAGSGMEYPALGLFGYTSDKYEMESIFAHEICHEWFYAAVGANEREYPFMDESITTSLEERYIEYFHPGRKLWEVLFKKEKAAKFFNLEYLPYSRLKETEWLRIARNNDDPPFDLPADTYDQEKYNIAFYNKASRGFDYMRAYLGDSLFDMSLKKYVDEFKFRHPYPSDMKSAFESVSGKDLSWFFQDMAGSGKRLDYKIIKSRTDQVLVKNRLELISPLLLYGMSGDSVHFKKVVDGFRGRRWIDLPGGDPAEVIIDPYHVTPELYRLNNNIRTSGILRRSDRLRTQLYLTLEDTERLNLMFLPLVNWNREDGFMAGAAFHNGILVPKRIEYFIMPFYSFMNKAIPGTGSISFNFLPYDFFLRKITFTIEGSQFGAPAVKYYRRALAGADFYIRSNRLNSPVQHSVFSRYIAASSLSGALITGESRLNSYLQYGYRLSRQAMINPFNANVRFENGKNYMSGIAEFRYRLSYRGRNKGADMRFFAGGIIGAEKVHDYYNLSPSGRSGPELYLYEGFFPDRFSSFQQNFWSRQMSITEGGLVSPLSLVSGYTRSLFSLSLSSTLPGKLSFIPVRPFINFVSDISAGGIFAESGLKTGIPGFFEIYFPFLVTGGISSHLPLLKDRIRFTLELNVLRKVEI